MSTPARAAGRSAAEPCGARQHCPQLSLVAPPAYEAFRMLHGELYLAYARAHLDAEAARVAVRSAFALIALHWSHVVAQPRPAAAAWDQLVASTGSRGRPLPVDADSPLQYDAVVLHGLGHSSDRIAEATGCEPGRIRCLVLPRLPEFRRRRPA